MKEERRGRRGGIPGCSLFVSDSWMTYGRGYGTLYTTDPSVVDPGVYWVSDDQLCQYVHLRSLVHYLYLTTSPLSDLSPSGHSSENTFNPILYSTRLVSVNVTFSSRPRLSLRTLLSDSFLSYIWNKKSTIESIVIPTTIQVVSDLCTFLFVETLLTLLRSKPMYHNYWELWVNLDKSPVNL